MVTECQFSRRRCVARIALVGLVVAMSLISCTTTPQSSRLAEEIQPRSEPVESFAPQVVQGIIDWGGPRPRMSAKVRHIYKEGWHEQYGTNEIQWYAVEDGLILCPKAGDIDAFAPIGVLAGAVLADGSPGHARPLVDRYELWLWQDVNFNRQADPDDRIKGELQQWRCIARGNPHKLNWMISVIPEESEFGKPSKGLYAGEPYLLLIRVYAGKLDSFQFTGPVTADAGSGATKAAWGRRVVNNWTPSGPGAYGGADGSGWHGIDDYEILSFRINNPPGRPIAPK